MRSEDHLQTRVSSTLYLLGAAVMLLLSIQNYRYGLYPLVYSASIIMTILLGLAIHARLVFNPFQLNRAALWGISLGLLLIFKEALHSPVEVEHWAFPMGLLAFVTLKHPQAMVVTSATAALLSLCLLFQEGLVRCLSFATSYTLLIALASTYARLQQQRNRTLVELEIRDPLTKAYNYRHFEDTLIKEMCRTDRTERPLSLIALEIDYFPQLVDLHGTIASNNLLCQLTESLRSMTRAGDSQYFDGEHTFYLLLPCTPSEGVVVFAERVRRSVEESSWPTMDSISISLGCTTYINPEREMKAGELINNASIALVEAQKNGHNRVCHH